jgi:hypothetical protein
MKKLPFFLTFSLLYMGISSCKKELPPSPSTLDVSNSTILELEFEHKVDNQSLVFSSQSYTNHNGDTYNITMFKYYVSNFSLIDENGNTVTLPLTYHIIDASNPDSEKIKLLLPAGNYKAINFMLGVDSLHNVSGAQTGALDPDKGMFWDWNTGYIFFMMEGASPQAANNQLRFHVGGFKGANNAIRVISTGFNSNKLSAQVNKECEIKMNVNVSEVFKNPHTISFSALSTIHMPGGNAVKMADNYQNMFSVREVKSN